MTTYYVDYANGSSGNGGSGWGDAKVAIADLNGSLGAGDIVKVAKSPDAVDTGMDATWNNGSLSVSIESQVTELIHDGQTAFTSGTNVTCSTDTTYWKSGTKSAKFAPNSSFVAGTKMGYKSFTTKDLSGYRQLSFWIRCSGTLVADDIRIKLCSDTLGDTEVDYFSVPALEGGRWHCFTINKGSALGSSIQSISLYGMTTTVRSKSIYLGYVITCKNPSSVDSLSLSSLISKNSGSEAWWGIATIDGTTVTLDGAPDSWPADRNNYYGTSETVPLYKREPTIITATTITASGAAGNHIQVKGGYNTGTDAQDGETFLARNGPGYAIYTSNGNYWTFEKISVFRCRYGFYIYNSVAGTRVDLSGYQVGNCYEGITGDGDGAPSTYTFTNIIACTTGLDLWGSGFIKLVVTNLLSNNYGVSLGEGNYEVIADNICANGYGVYCDEYGFVYVQADYIKENAIGLYIEGQGKVVNSAFSNNTTSSVAHRKGILDLVNISSTDTYLVDVASWSTDYSGNINCIRVTDQSGVHKILSLNGNIVSQDSVRHTASGIAWQLSPTNSTYLNELAPMKLLLAVLAVNASKEVTVSCWYRRSNTGLTAKLVCREGQIAGVANDVSDSMTEIADTWQQLTISFTPTEAGVVEIECWVYGGTTYSGFVDDITIEQAA